MGLLVVMVLRAVIPGSVDYRADFQLCRGALSTQERKDYINAVLCLQKLPSRLDPEKFPGARTRYDDFVGVHINQTLSIHITVRIFFNFIETFIPLFYLANDSADT
jgi:hypothetical protein